MPQMQRRRIEPLILQAHRGGQGEDGGMSDLGLYQSRLTAAVYQGSAEDWYALGATLHDLKKWGAAAACFSKAWQKDPTHYRARTNRAWNWHLFGRTVEAAQELDKVCQTVKEGTPHALYSQILGTLGLDDEAVNFGRLGVEYEPHVPLNHLSLAFALMSRGEWKEGLLEYEHRFAFKIPEFLTRPYRLWRGERVDSLYIECEQGVGDSIMGLRWLIPAAERAEQVTLYVHQHLYALLDLLDVPENVRALPLPQPLPQADAWSPLWSLPVALEMTEPWGEPTHYIYREIGSAYTRARAAAIPLHVGVAFQGSPAHEQSHHRDCPLEYWLSLFEVPGIVWHSLQVGFDVNDQNAPLNRLATHGLIRDRSPEITNFLDTARIVSGLDLVISVDTAVAHLAGAMGVPTWLLLNQRGLDFRWGRRGETTPWYPSAKLYRRAIDEDTWIPLMNRIKADLGEWVR